MIRGPFEYGRRDPPRGPAPETEPPRELLHIHGREPGEDTYSCGSAADYKTPFQGREAKPGEQVTCPSCLKLLARIRTFYTFSGKRRKGEPAARDYR
jgi:hypothetical protein